MCKKEKENLMEIGLEKGEDGEPDTKSEDRSGGDIYQRFRSIFLYFHYRGKKYIIGLSERIRTIERYVFTKHNFKPMLEMSRGLRYKTIEERTHNRIVDERTHKVVKCKIEWDMYNYTRIIAHSISQELRGYVKHIWQPIIP